MKQLLNRNPWIVAVLALLPMGIALAGTEIDETRSMPADGRVQVDNLAGSIDINAWDRNEVRITGELGDGVEELEIGESAQGVTVVVRNRRNQRYVEETRLHLTVPVAASIIAEGVSADISVSGLDGGRFDLSTVSGDIDVEARAARVDVESVSGDVTFRGRTSRISVETVSGEIDLAGVDGEVQVTTVSGDAELEGGTVTVARFETVSGDLDADVDVAGGGRLSADSMSGDVRIVLDDAQQGNFSAQTYSGDIRTDFGAVDAGSRGPGRRLNHREGDGGAIIEIENFSGDIRILRR
ncbi:DUF4097 family beta strand repeat-containing protein [Elongatibacter sediminis]|uniref:DUF4097 family beta strand repeat-containing protein n=1 Tax=Elongatibacter sediminis TaxID=3119006 RepID=A0AAW9RN27_9GAMM